MAQRARERSSDDRYSEQPTMTVREAATTARDYLSELAGQEPVAMTSVELTDDDGWVVEFEVLEERRIPSSSDILALYEVELDADGELLAFRRTRRYLRGHTGQTNNGGEPT